MIVSDRDIVIHHCSHCLCLQRLIDETQEQYILSLSLPLSIIDPVCPGCYVQTALVEHSAR